MLAMANDPDLGLLGIFGAVIAAGVFTIIVAPAISYLPVTITKWPPQERKY